MKKANHYLWLHASTSHNQATSATAANWIISMKLKSLQLAQCTYYCRCCQSNCFIVPAVHIGGQSTARVSTDLDNGQVMPAKSDKSHPVHNIVCVSRCISRPIDNTWLAVDFGSLSAFLKHIWYWLLPYGYLYYKSTCCRERSEHYPEYAYF